MPRELRRRLDAIEAALNDDAEVLVLDTGETVRIHRFAVWEVCMAAADLGPWPDLATVEVLARSRPRRGDGAIDAPVRDACRRRLKEFAA